ncbi:MAG TPA: MFS transporter [Gemmataceae bacterium]|nr:MFS transporter [Gemmataceae bacterium]
MPQESFALTAALVYHHNTSGRCGQRPPHPDLAPDRPPMGWIKQAVNRPVHTGRSPSAPPIRPTHRRYVFLFYAAALSLVLYLDRICIAESADDIVKVLGLDPVQRGWMFTAFTLGYMLFEVPTGAWGDRYGPKRVLCRIVLWWSLFTALTGCITAFTLDSSLTFLGVPLLLDGFILLLVIRFLFGAGEAGAYPNIAKCSSRWFPVRERGLAQGVVATAGRLGGGIASAVTIAVTAFVNERLWPGMGWRVTFWLFGLLGVVWVVAFAWWFRNDPAEHPAVNAAELALIEEDRAGERAEAGTHLSGTPWRAMLTSGNLWAYSAMAFCSAFVVYLYFTWFPTYLRQRHDVPRETWGWVAGLPMICGAIGCTLGGLCTDWLVRRTGSRRWGRRIMGLVGKGGRRATALRRSKRGQPGAGGGADRPVGLHQRPGPGGPLGGLHRRGRPVRRHDLRLHEHGGRDRCGAVAGPGRLSIGVAFAGSRRRPHRPGRPRARLERGTLCFRAHAGDRLTLLAPY